MCTLVSSSNTHDGGALPGWLLVKRTRHTFQGNIVIHPFDVLPNRLREFAERRNALLGLQFARVGCAEAGIAFLEDAFAFFFAGHNAVIIPCEKTRDKNKLP